MKKLDNLNKSYSYQNTAEFNANELLSSISNKTVIPYQVEFQPPPASLRKICWLECEYCYGASADDTQAPRMDEALALQVLKDIIDGGVKKVIFAGYATDPLNSPYINKLLSTAIEGNLIFGFNTKALKVSDNFIELLKQPKIVDGSYISLSVDAGSNQTYNTMHAVTSNAKIYDRVLRNANLMREANPELTISAAYLINKTNDNLTDIQNFISDFRSAGCNFLRFSFLQQPKDVELDHIVLPNKGEQDAIKSRIRDLIESESSEECLIRLVDIDESENIFRKARTVPCFARFIFPTVGYDGWLYNCSQSSSPNFHTTALGNLAENNFWDLYYNYNFQDQKSYFRECSEKLIASGCRCDRKMHLANKSLALSGKFNYD